MVVANHSSDEAIRLLPIMLLDCLVNLGSDRVEVERRRVLHRRIVDRRCRELADVLLNHDESPEFACKEIVAISKRTGERRFSCDHRESLEGILPNVNDTWHVGFDLRPRPALRLRKK